MRYLCVQCDERFDSDEARPRCPKCMRVHGIQRLDEADTATHTRGKQWGAAIAVVLVVGGLAASAYLRGGSAPPSAEQAASRLSDKGIATGELAGLLTADAGLTSLAHRASSGDAQARAKAVVAALRARAAKQAFVPWSLVDPRERPLMTAAETWAAIAQDGARLHLYPLEISAVAVVALREAGVGADVAEIQAYPGEEAPLDPSGCLGYFGVIVGEGEGATVLDPYAGRERSPEPSAVTRLSDEQVIAAALGIRALHAIAWAGDAGHAVKDIEAALSLWPKSPSLRSVRAVVLASGGGLQEGEEALSAALAMRPDAARYNNLAAYQLQRGQVDTASQTVAKALELAPEYAAARVVLAGVHLARQEGDLAQAQLTQAEALDPDLPTLPLAWAQYYAGQGDLDRAIVRAEQGVKLRPKQAHLHLNLGRLYRMASRYDDMRRAARAALALTPPARSGEMRKLIEMLLGPTAFEDVDVDSEPTDAPTSASDPPAAAAEPSGLPGLSDDALDVSRGSRLLSGKPLTGGLQPGNGAPKLDVGGSDLTLDGDTSGR